jgi:cellulose synthase operon protein C
MQRFEIKDAEEAAQRALKINPRLTDALRLQADVHLFAGNVGEALKALAKARETNPREEATLARIAACLHIERKRAEVDALVKEVEAHNSKPAVFYHELAERLEERRLFHDAEKYFELAAKLQPQLPYASNGLGLLYMRQGREEEARKILDKSFDADPFNIRVHNTLKVLDHLDKYTTLKTEHFLLRYDPANDKVLAAFVAKYLEDIYAELADKFQYRPKGPILIEVFNKHEMFSGRVVALPDLHTIGACTGSVVAMVSPRDKSKVIGKPFNWARVLRHELVHIFNLEQTKFQVPHWFTEGLAVMYEGTPPPPRWDQLLAEKVHAKELMNLDNVLLGFIRPGSPDEWHQAYLQSLLYVEYLIRAHGDKSVAGMLAAFSDGLDTDSAIFKVCKVSKAEFEKGYRAFLEQRVKRMPVSAASGLSLKELRAAHDKDPKDANVAAQLAERLLNINDKADAGRLADEALATNKTHALAAYVKARLLVEGGEKDRALTLLDSVKDAKPPEAKALKLLAKLQADQKKFAEAAGTLERGRKLEPREPNWLIQLARMYNQLGDKQKLIDVLQDLVPTDADDLVTRRKLAQLLSEADRHADAERYARMALEIDVLDAEAQRVLEAALTAQNKEAELAQLRKMLGK